MILRFEIVIAETHLLWGVYTYTTLFGSPKNPEDVLKWIQAVILREGTKEFRRTIDKWEKEIPDDTHYTHAEHVVHEWWPDEQG